MQKIVGHVPKDVSKTFYFFIKRGGTIRAKVHVVGVQENLDIGIQSAVAKKYGVARKHVQVWYKH